MRSQAVRATGSKSHRSPIALWASVAVAFGAVALSAGPSRCFSQQSTELTSVRAIRHLKQPAAVGIPVHIRGVATYYDTVAPNLFVQDKTAGIWVDLRGLKEPAPSPGDVIDLRGT